MMSFRILGKGLFEEYKIEIINHILKDFGKDDLNDFYYSIAISEINISDIIKLLEPFHKTHKYKVKIETKHPYHEPLA